MTYRSAPLRCSSQGRVRARLVKAYATRAGGLLAGTARLLSSVAMVSARDAHQASQRLNDNVISGVATDRQVKQAWWSRRLPGGTRVPSSGGVISYVVGARKRAL